MPAGSESPRRSWASVAVVRAGDHLLFVQRTARPGDPWSGDMAFPGGLAAPEDADPLATARRETREEVGIELPDPCLVLPRRLIPHPRWRRLAPLVPYVFEVPTRPVLVLEPSEIAAAHWVPLAYLRSARTRRWIRVRGWLPWWASIRDWEGQRIWGLTGRMVDELLRRTGP